MNPSSRTMTAASRLVLVLSLGLLFSAPAAAHEEFRVLVFSKTAGFRHDSIPAGIQALQQLGVDYHFGVTATEDAAAFTPANLAQYEAVVFLSTTGDVLDSTQQAALEGYVRSGKGWVGVHAASDTEYSWPWYGQLVGAWFNSHPANQNATIKVEDRVHPSTSALPARWTRFDEWYNFSQNPRGTVHVLASLDEKSYSGGNMGADHPIAWCQPFQGGRSWYTGGGHTVESFSEPAFRAHLANGILWAAGRVAGDCAATISSAYEKQVLQTGLLQPMSMKVAPDGRVFFVERAGLVRIYSPSTQSTVTAGNLSVTADNEDGLLGLALDPGFAVNQYLYLYYSPSGTSVNRLSRFTMSGNQLQLSSERMLLEVPVDRICCHSGGDLEFDAAGNLYLAIGDNTNPFESDGFAPADERAGRAHFDAQRTAGNPNDLRGKILRITPNASGTYSIPAGNLFPSGGAQGRPEIYVMGNRNPFRMAVDPVNNWLYWGEVGPDARANSSRGPQGYDEFNQARSAGNYGWPYCIADNKAYADYDFATGALRGNYSCAAPVNDSPNNTGARTLPAARGALIWYPYGISSEFPELGEGGRTATAGAVYRFDPASTSSSRFPQYYDKTLFVMEWSRLWIKSVKLDDAGQVLKINPFLPGTTFNMPIDMAFGADGNMYLLEYGTGWGNNNDAVLSRVRYVGLGNKSPIVRASANRTNGLAPLAVQFSSAGTVDPEGGALTYAWDLDGNGTVDSTAANPSRTYSANGVYTVRLTARDVQGATSSANLTVTVGNTAPTVALGTLVNGGFFGWGDTIPYSITVTDPEDGAIDCARVTLLPSLGHDGHAHADSTHFGCSGAFTTQVSDTSIENTFYIAEASYTDNGANGVPALTGGTAVKLHSKDKQGENYDLMSGIQVEATTDTGGGRNVGFIDNGDWLMWRGMNLYRINSMRFRVASAASGGTIEMRASSPTGTLLSTVTVPGTGGWQTWTTVTSALASPPAGQYDIYFVFKGGAGSLFNVNWIEFVGQGVSAPPRPTTTVALRAAANNKWVAAENGGASPLIANRDAVGLWETFELIDLGGGNVALKALANNKYVVAENAGAGALIANRDAIGPWETFQRVDLGNGNIALRALANSRYVCADNAGASALIANRDAVGLWETFFVQPVTP